MNQIEINQKDVEMLLKWRDEHTELVRSLPSPFKAIEIVCLHNGVRIKGIRNNSILKLSLNENGRSLGSCIFKILLDGKVVLTENRMKTIPDNIQSVLTVYCSLMALIAYDLRINSNSENFAAENIVNEDRGASSSNTKAKNETHKRPQKRVTYLLKSKNGNLRVCCNGIHHSPSGVFSVRGHYRHLRNGSVIWINEYKKGTGKEKKKVYKIGKENNSDYQKAN